LAKKPREIGGFVSRTPVKIVLLSNKKECYFMNIADRIQNLRKSRGISQEEFADKIGVSRQTVSKWESEQSLPDIDKVIIMSDYFEVTADYILKGIESKKQEKETGVNAIMFLAVATPLNFIGLIVAIAIWHYEHTPMAIVGGLIFMAVSCMVFGIGWANSTQNVEKAKRLFFVINIWFFAFIPMSFLYNVLFTRSIAPYPVFGWSQSIISIPAFFLVYLAVCLTVVFTQGKVRGIK
jgi:transcriptional regulator with XRE-family HTH domain